MEDPYADNDDGNYNEDVDSKLSKTISFALVVGVNQ